jgi:SAM-dependent methyltransferase
MSGTAEVNGVLWGESATDWAAIQERTCEPVYRAAFERVGLAAGARYLDAGCGAGLAASIAAERGAVVSGLDAAESLLAIARERVPTGDFRQGELEALPFADGSFDLVTGFNSFQYAANPVAALGEAKRVAKVDGLVVVMTWGEREGMEAAELLGALRTLLPKPPAGAPGPFALSAKEALSGFAGDAGLEVVEIFDVDCPWVYQDMETALRGLGSSGVSARAAGVAGREAVDAAHAEALKAFVQADGSYRIGAWFRCLVARG